MPAPEHPANLTGAAASRTHRLAALWHSATATTFGSLLTRSISLIVLLPLVLARLSTEEIVLWYLFAAIASLQLLMDLGFNPTFVRATAYTMGGADAAALATAAPRMPAAPNWVGLERIWSTMHDIYHRLGAVWLLALATLGTWAVARPIGLTADAASAWLAWAVVAGTSALTLGCSAYAAFVFGVDEVARLRRWEIVTSVGATLSGAAALLFGSGLIGLVIAYYAWQLVAALGNRHLARTVLGGRARRYAATRRDAAVLAAVWPLAWRTSVGVFAGFALVQLSGVLYAQVASAAAAASYLLALRLIQILSQFSQAPFYSQLPALARLYSEGRRDELIAVAQRGMGFAHATFVCGFVALAAGGDPLLRLIGSRAPFPDVALWTLLGLAMFAERYGAMHIQLYSTTNRIVNHLANGGAAIVCVAVVLLGYPALGVYAFPAGLLAGNLGFYAWFAASRSYAAFGLAPWAFERRALLAPLGVFLVYLGGLAVRQFLQ